MRRTAIVLAAIVGAGAAGACWLLPDRYAVNAPLANLLFGSSTGGPSDAVFAARVRAAPGFRVERWAGDLPGARGLRVTETGDLLVALSRRGEIVLLEPDADGDGRSDGRRVVQAGLDKPHGVELHDGWLYVGETDAIGRLRFDAPARTSSGSYARIVRDLPTGGHWTRTVRVGPDGWLYVSIGSSCNVCREEDPRRAAILRYRTDGSGEEIFATGLRNAVGFDWHPTTGELFATDNGRDLLGDDFPPCELNRVVQGGFFGWPFANGANLIDPDHGAGNEARVAAAIPPVHEFRAHTAPLGIRFVRGASAPADYRGAAVVALHGSWNRTRKDGYAVVSLHWRPDGTIEERSFLTGFLKDEDVIGRPVDVEEGPDGALYVSDDYAGAVYRVTAEPRSAQ